MGVFGLPSDDTKIIFIFLVDKAAKQLACNGFLAASGATITSEQSL